MSTPFYTTRDLQDMLQVDRTTIYRMAESSRLPGMKVGNQWRFPRRLIDQWLHAQTPGATVDATAPAQIAAFAPLATGAFPSAPVAPAPADILPLECVQLMQDAFADALGVMIVITDLAGQLVTRTSNSCGLLQAIEAHPQGHARCLAWWAEIAARPELQPSFIRSQVGLLCTRAFIRCGSELCGMVVFGGITPSEWPPTPGQIEQIAAFLGMDAASLHSHVMQVYTIDPAQEQRLFGLVQRFADVITHMIRERSTLLRASTAPSPDRAQLQALLPVSQGGRK